MQSLSAPAALGVTCVALGGVAATRRILAGKDAPLPIQRMLMGIWLVGLLCGFIAVKLGQNSLRVPQSAMLLTQFVAAAFVWWRGMALGQSVLGPEETQQRFRVGLLLFGVYAVVSLLIPAYDLLPYLLPFLLAVLLALPLSFLERVEQSPTGQHVRMTWRWWRFTLLSAGLTLLVSLGVMALFTPGLLNRALFLLVGLLLLPTVILGPLLDVLAALMRALMREPPPDPIPASGLEELRRQLRGAEGVNFPVAIDDQVVSALVIAVLFAALLMMVLTTRRARRQVVRVQRSEDEGEALPDTLSPVDPGPPAPLLALRGWLAALTIRRVYARMAHEAGKRGFTRLPSQTPYDYLPYLGSAFPGADAEVRLITDAYVAAHYGEAPDSSEELARIRSAWARARRRSGTVS
jgi:hypothetical protein